MFKISYKNNIIKITTFNLYIIILTMLVPPKKISQASWWCVQ